MAHYKVLFVDNPDSKYNGKYAIGRGNKFYPNMGTFGKLEDAERQLQIELIQHHYNEIQKAREALADLNNVHWTDIDWGDYVC